MKKRVILAIMTVAMSMSMSMSAQVQFSRFKYYVANIMDFSHLQLEAKFKVTGERNIKYLHVFYSPLNSVGDAIVDEDGHKYFHIYCTGPFEPKNSYTKHFDPYFFVGKKPSPFPSKIVIDYIGGGSDTIQITKDNIKKYFPCLKWVDVDYNRKF